MIAVSLRIVKGGQAHSVLVPACALRYAVRSANAIALQSTRHSDKIPSATVFGNLWLISI